MATCETRTGKLPNNGFGQVYEGMIADIQMYNDENRFTAFVGNLFNLIALSCTIDCEGERVFTGWVHNISLSHLRTGRHTVQLGLVGPIHYIGNYHDRPLVLLDDNATPQDAIREVVNATGAPVPLVVSGDFQDIVLSAPQTNTSGGLTAGANRVDFLQSIALLAKVGVGVMYDDRNGNLVYECYGSRSPRRNDIRWTFDGGEVRAATTGLNRDIVINTVFGERDELVSTGTGNVTISNVSLPLSLISPPGGTTGYTLLVDAGSNVQLVQNYSVVIRIDGQDYTIANTSRTPVTGHVEAWVVPLQEGLGARLFLHVSPLSRTSITIEVRSVSAQTFGFKPGLFRVGTRDSRSYDIYQERATQYPLQLVTAPDVVQDIMSDLVERHNGISPIDGSRQLLRRLEVELNANTMPEYLTADIGDFVRVSSTALGLQNAFFFIEEIQHELTDRGETIIRFGLMDMRARSTSPASSIIPYANTITGIGEGPY